MKKSNFENTRYNARTTATRNRNKEHVQPEVEKLAKTINTVLPWAVGIRLATNPFAWAIVVLVVLYFLTVIHKILTPIFAVLNWTGIPGWISSHPIESISAAIVSFLIAFLIYEMQKRK